MNVSVLSRNDVYKIIVNGEFPKNTAVITFFDPPNGHSAGYQPVDYSDVTDDVFYVCIPDIDWDAFENDPEGIKAFFPQAGEAAEFILKAHDEGKDIICQCDYGQSRSAGCAMAILEYFECNGKKIFEDQRYFPNQLVFGKILSALKQKQKDVAAFSP